MDVVAHLPTKPLKLIKWIVALETMILCIGVPWLGYEGKLSGQPGSWIPTTFFLVTALNLGYFVVVLLKSRGGKRPSVVVSADGIVGNMYPSPVTVTWEELDAASVGIVLSTPMLAIRPKNMDTFLASKDLLTRWALWLNWKLLGAPLALYQYESSVHLQDLLSAIERRTASPAGRVSSPWYTDRYGVDPTSAPINHEATGNSVPTLSAVAPDRAPYTPPQDDEQVRLHRG